jgi:hypothetical protein
MTDHDAGVVRGAGGAFAIPKMIRSPLRLRSTLTAW